MNENRTTSILQRVPKILAVTAASYGLDQQARTMSTSVTSKVRPSAQAQPRQGKPH